MQFSKETCIFNSAAYCDISLFRIASRVMFELETEITEFG